MDETQFAIAAMMLPALMIVGGVVVMVWGIRHATRQSELQHEERMAMIERGMTPPESPRHERQRRAHGFKMSLGILLCGLGLGLLMLLTFAAGDAGSGLGIGGAVVMVGVAFVVSALFTARQDPSADERPAARRAGAASGREWTTGGGAAAEPLVRRRDFDEPAPPGEPPPAG
ncbi:MAG: DUF6249 domain-containing protein [Vicinamibacterales bacterium]